MTYVLQCYLQRDLIASFLAKISIQDCHFRQCSSFLSETTGMQSPPMETLLTTGPDGVKLVFILLSFILHFRDDWSAIPSDGDITYNGT